MSASKPERRSSGLIVQKHAGKGELSIFDTKTQIGHTFKQLTATVWNYCDGRHTPAMIADKVRSELGIEQPLPLVEEAVRELSSAGLLKGIGSKLRVFTRRASLRAIGATAMGLALLAFPRVAKGSG